MAFGVAVDVTALWVCRSLIDARGLEGGGIGDGDVAVDAFEEGRVFAGYSVEVRACGQSLRGPLGVVPASTEDPGVRVVEGLRVGRDA